MCQNKVKKVAIRLLPIAIQPHPKSTTQRMIFLSIIKTRNMQAKLLTAGMTLDPMRCSTKMRKKLLQKVT